MRDNAPRGLSRVSTPSVYYRSMAEILPFILGNGGTIYKNCQEILSDLGISRPCLQKCCKNSTGMPFKRCKQLLLMDESLREPHKARLDHRSLSISVHLALPRRTTSNAPGLPGAGHPGQLEIARYPRLTASLLLLLLLLLLLILAMALHGLLVPPSLHAPLCSKGLQSSQRSTSKHHMTKPVGCPHE